MIDELKRRNVNEVVKLRILLAQEQKKMRHKEKYIRELIDQKQVLLGDVLRLKEEIKQLKEKINEMLLRS